MPILFKSKLSSAVANATFVDKTIDDLKKGKLSLYKVTVGESGFVDDVQVYLNEIADTSGQTGEGDPNRKVYATNNIIANGDSRKAAIEKFDVQVQANVDALAALGDANKLESFATDSAYEIANGAPTGGEIYYNTTTGLIRYYDAVDSAWKPVGAQIVGNQEFLGFGDGSTVDFALSFNPINDLSVAVYNNGLIVDEADYTFTTATNVQFTVAPASGQAIYVYYFTEGTPASPPVASGSFEVDYITLTSTMITVKSLTLGALPAEATKVLCDVAEGSTKVYGTDYTVSTNTVSWSGLGLDGQVIAGDILRFTYIT